MNYVLHQGLKSTAFFFSATNSTNFFLFVLIREIRG